jgi:hypothetical protein
VDCNPKELKAGLSKLKAQAKAVILCHESSSSVDRDMVDIMGSTFNIDLSFLRQHLDYKSLVFERACPNSIVKQFWEDFESPSKDWKVITRWNPVRLPSESKSFLRLQLEDDCISIQVQESTGTVFESQD